MKTIAIITSPYLALCVRLIAIPPAIAALILTILISTSSHTNIFTAFLISIILSLISSTIEATCLIFDFLRPALPLIPPGTYDISRPPRASHNDKRSYRASPRWRGFIDVALLIAIMLGVLGVSDCSKNNLAKPEEAKWCFRGDMGMERDVAVVLGVIVGCAHFWMSGMACLECFWQHREKERVRRTRSVS